MCILFIYVDISAPSDGYQLIVANNRDEYYDRPTRPAGRWLKNPSCVSGLDQEPGREGGTWLGLSEACNGRVASLLNILSEHPKTCMKGRGFLVTDYLSRSVSATEYTAPLSDDRASYNPFNLVILEKISHQWNLHYFSSDDMTSPCDINLRNEKIHIFGNSSRTHPWKKVQDGREIFSKIINQHKTLEEKQLLIDGLIAMLNNSTRHWPDPQLQSQATVAEMDEDATIQRSAVFVESPHIRYGSRTNTVIVVDANGNGEYIERTMREPVNVQDPMWDTNTINFKFGCN